MVIPSTRRHSVLIISAPTRLCVGLWISPLSLGLHRSVCKKRSARETLQREKADAESTGGFWLRGWIAKYLRSLALDVVDIASGFARCLHAVVEILARTLEAALGHGLQFSEFALFGVELARSAGEWISLDFSVRAGMNFRWWCKYFFSIFFHFFQFSIFLVGMQSAPMRIQSGAERRHLRLRLLGKSFVHADRLKCRIHALAEHVDDIDARGGIVAVVVTALARGVVARACAVRLAAGSAAAVGGARIGHLGRRHGDAGDRVMIGGCF